MRFEQLILGSLAVLFGASVLACFHHGMAMHQHVKIAPAFLRFMNLAVYFKKHQTERSQYHLRRHLLWGVASFIAAIAIIVAMYLLVPGFRAEVSNVIGSTPA